MSESHEEGPIAGPSSRPWVADPRWNAWHGGALSNQYARDASTDVKLGRRPRKAREKSLVERQDAPTPTEPDTGASSVPPPDQPAAAPTETAPVGSPAPSPSPAASSPYPNPVDGSPSSSSAAPPLFSGARNETINTPSSSSSTLAPSDSYPIYTSSSLPWSTRTSHRSSAPTPTFVPGVTLNMTLAGDSDLEAVYAVPVELGHGAESKRRKRAPGDGSFSQTMNVQIDLGSSDMWLAAGDCSSSACAGFGMLFDDSQSLDSGVDANFTYQSGSVAGDIYWEQLSIGTFQIGYQAFISATTVTNQDLINGNFTGVLGLSFPAASTIQTRIPGTTSSNPDGATFLDNLFGSGIYAPTNRVFSMALERREDVRTRSLLTIGETSNPLCPEPCSPNQLPVIPQSRLGSTGFVHWRIPLIGITATTWDNAKDGQDARNVTIPLGPSFVETSRTTPLAVLDSGGVQILVGRRSYADAIYNAFGVSAGSDGLCKLIPYTHFCAAAADQVDRLPCKTPLALTFDFGGVEVPVHPLDMTYPDPSDPSQNTCIGMIQYANNLGNDVGDFILGSSFLKNVYSIYNYPDQVRSTRWQPTIGLVPLTNASVASRDFYAVRTERQSLRSVSSDQSPLTGPNPWNPETSAAPGDGGGGKKAVSTAVIVACSVVGFFVLAAAAFCAWWFWLRRKFGAAGVVEYKRKGRDEGSNHDSDYSGSTLRDKKHRGTMRQKSMIEGYSDYEGDSWVSETGDSIRLGHIPEEAEDDEDGGQARPTAADLGGDDTPKSTRILEDSALLDEPLPILASARDESPSGHRGSSPGRRLSMASPENRSSFSQAGPYPTMAKSSTSRSLSVSMTGPFPSGQLARPSSMRPDASPMYDINTSDYFHVPARGRDPKRGSHSRERTHTPSGPGMSNPANPFDTP